MSVIKRFMPNFDADYILMKHLVEEQKHKHHDRDINTNLGYYNISQVYKCLRMHYYSIYDPQSLCGDGLRRVSMGNIMQDYIDPIIVNHFKDETNQFKTVTRIERSLAIPIKMPGENTGYIYATGRIDHLLAYKLEDNYRYYFPIECKYLIDKLVGDLLEPKPIHLFQINLYLLAMGGQSGAIYYVDHHLNIKTFYMDLDLDIIEEAFNRLVGLHYFVKASKLPPAEAMYNQNNKDYLKGQCYFCPYYKQCKQVEQQK